MNDEVLTVEDIASLWKVTRQYAQRYLVKRPEFPDPIPGSTRKNQRWRRSEVLALLQVPAENPA